MEDNIRLPALVLRLGTAETRKRLDRVYGQLPQLPAMRTSPRGGVSGGQGKIVTLWRALMVAREALLLDEPFQALEPALAQDYARTLRDQRSHRPQLMILITESCPWMLEKIADQILQIDRGEVLCKPVTE